MKRITILAAIVLASVTSVFAQSVEFTPLFGYTISGKVDGYYGSYDVKDDIMYGALLDVEFEDMLHFELSYRRSDPQLVEKRYLGGTITNYNIGVEHYQVGVIKDFNDGNIRPFAGFALGTTRYIGKGRSKERYWLFSSAIELGAKMYLTDNIGIRLQSNLTLPMEFAGGGLFCGIGSGGGGCSGNVHFNVPLVHWDLSAGLIFRLAK